MEDHKVKISVNFDLTLKQLLLSNVHLGHTSRFLNSQIKPYLLGRRNKVYFLNLVHTIVQMRLFLNFIMNLISKRSNILIVKEFDLFNFWKLIDDTENVFFYDKKWIGGLLTNFRLVWDKKRFKRKKFSSPKLHLMRYLPSLIVFLDVNLSRTGVKETSLMDIPIAAFTDVDVKFLYYINYLIVGNNKSFETLVLYFSLIRNAVLKGYQKEIIKILNLI